METVTTLTARPPTIHEVPPPSDPRYLLCRGGPRLPEPARRPLARAVEQRFFLVGEGERARLVADGRLGQERFHQEFRLPAVAEGESQVMRVDGNLGRADLETFALGLPTEYGLLAIAGSMIAGAGVYMDAELRLA